MYHDAYRVLRETVYKALREADADLIIRKIEALYFELQSYNWLYLFIMFFNITLVGMIQENILSSHEIQWFWTILFFIILCVMNTFLRHFKPYLFITFKKEMPLWKIGICSIIYVVVQILIYALVLYKAGDIQTITHFITYPVGLLILNFILFWDISKSWLQKNEDDIWVTLGNKVVIVTLLVLLIAQIGAKQFDTKYNTLEELITQKDTYEDVLKEAEKDDNEMLIKQYEGKLKESESKIQDKLKGVNSEYPDRTNDIRHYLEDIYNVIQVLLGCLLTVFFIVIDVRKKLIEHQAMKQNEMTSQ